LRIVAIDDEQLALENLVHSIMKADEFADVYGSRKPEDIIDRVTNDAIDVAFVDIEMRTMNGINLAEKLRSINPRINIIFTTGYSEYTGEAFKMHASGYILKPITPTKVKEELSVLRFSETPSAKPLLDIRTFGSFEVFVNGDILQFQYSKSKELLAYLVDRRGALVSNNEIIANLWEGENIEQSHISYFKNIRTDLIQVLKNSGCEDAIIRQRGYLAIAMDRVKCDYYDYLGGIPGADKLYMGEYMSRYSWAEPTQATLQFGSGN